MLMKYSYIDHAVNHQVPVSKHGILEVSVVDEVIDDTAVILDTKGLQKSSAEQMSQEMSVFNHSIRKNVRVVDH